MPDPSRGVEPRPADEPTEADPPEVEVLRADTVKSLLGSSDRWGGLTVDEARVLCASHERLRALVGGRFLRCTYCEGTFDNADDLAAHGISAHGGPLVGGIEVDLKGGDTPSLEETWDRAWREGYGAAKAEVNPDDPSALVGGRPAAPTFPGERAAYERWRETGDADAAAALDEFDARRRSAAPTRDDLGAELQAVYQEEMYRAQGLPDPGIFTAMADRTLALLSRSAAEPPEDGEAQRRASVAESIYQRHAEGWHAVLHECIQPPCWNRSNPDDTEDMTADQVAWMRGEPLPDGVAAEPPTEPQPDTVAYNVAVLARPACPLCSDRGTVPATGRGSDGFDPCPDCGMAAEPNEAGDGA